MKIALIGYGKMGQAIEKEALQRGHEIVLKINIDNTTDLTAESINAADVAIEFTGPESAVDNVKFCLTNQVPVVCGSTGWLHYWNDIETLCAAQNGSMVYASNYSIGVNLFFEVNKQLARLMATHTGYDVQMTEIHHTEKKDAPSGTAITLAEQILASIQRKKNWVDHTTTQPQELAIVSERIDPAPGTHKVKYTSPIDDIEIIHTAHNRTGFAAGAVMAAEFLQGKKGIFSMQDVLNL